jgi:prepilin-type N-terminal cleavage/methylation domain-containing protein
LQNRRMSEKRSSSLSSQCGFTLLEVMIAVMILGLSLTAILQQFSVAIRAGRKSHDVTHAMLHVKEKLEGLKVEKDLSESSDTGIFDDGCEWETRVEVFSYGEEGDDESYEDLKYETFSLVSTVTWNDGARKRSVELKTLKTVRTREWL